MELEKTLEGSLDYKEIKSVSSNENQFWMFIGRIDAEVEAQTWPSDWKSLLIWKDPDAGNDWKQEYKGMTEPEIVGWHHWPSGHWFEKAHGEGQGSLACCSSSGYRVSDMTELLCNDNDNQWALCYYGQNNLMTLRRSSKYNILEYFGSWIVLLSDKGLSQKCTENITLLVVIMYLLCMHICIYVSIHLYFQLYMFS